MLPVIPAIGRVSTGKYKKLYSQLRWQIQNFFIKFQWLGKCFVLSHTIKNQRYLCILHH